MRLIIRIAFFALFSLASGRRRVKCGFVDDKCFAPDDSRTCHELPLCPVGMKRRFTGLACCCVLRDAHKAPASLIEAEKTKILNNTLESIDDCFDSVKSVLRQTRSHGEHAEAENIERRARIESLGRRVSDVMREGIVRLAMLIDVEFEAILKLVFDDEKAHENEKLALVLEEASEIYEQGNAVLERITDAASVF